MSGWVWFVLGALWVAAIWVAWMFMKASNGKREEKMSDAWIERKRREREE